MSNGSPSDPAISGIVGFFLLIAAVVLFLHLSSTNADFSRYNPQWNGTSVFFQALENRDVAMMGDLGVLEGRQNTTLLVIAPARAPTTEEAAAFRAFVSAGNMLVLADDSGGGNDLLASVGSSIRLRRVNVSSLNREFEVSTALIGYPQEGETLVAGLSKIIFNHPVVVSGGDPIINTSYLSWIDENGNGRADRTEPFGRFTIAAEDRVGNGRVVVIGDASLFINSMQRLPDGDNERLIERVLAITTVVDQRISRTATAIGPVSTFLWVKETPSITIVVTALSLGALAWSFARRRQGTR